MLKLPREKVELGRPLPWNVRDEHGVLLLSKGHVVANEHQLDALLLRGAFVDVMEVKASAQSTPLHARANSQISLFASWDQTAESLRKLMLTIESDTEFVQNLTQFGQHIVSLIDANVDIGIYRCVRQDNAKNYYYGYNHSVHTALLCVLMARRLNWTQAKMMSLVYAALTMNISILDLQGQMAGQGSPVQERQRRAINQHPDLAVEMLQRIGVTDPDWLTAIAQHHERPDGSGYPRGITDIADIAVALRVTDVFMAKISPRALRAALPTQEAARQLYREDSGGPISTAIIKEFGIYPPGDFVRLASGELGLAVERTDNVKAPIVAVITDTAGRPVPSTVRRDTRAPGLAIVANVSNDAMLKRLPPERLYGFSVPGKPALPT